MCNSCKFWIETAFVLKSGSEVLVIPWPLEAVVLLPVRLLAKWELVTKKLLLKCLGEKLDW
jgi:hypothetical protein